jgi:hypothetical protein
LVQALLRPYVDAGLVLPLHTAHPPPRYGIRESASGAPWGGYREVQGRCLTHALLDGACWLLHIGVGQAPNGPLQSPAAASGSLTTDSVLSVYARCAIARSGSARGAQFVFVGGDIHCMYVLHASQQRAGTCVCGCGPGATCRARRSAGGGDYHLVTVRATLLTARLSGETG